jgi:pullulanase/glycogen debranching enzyme
MDCLRYWVVDMHVDGFRFDLGSILGRDQIGRLMENPPTLERIAEDPILSATKIIAEAWDAGGAYQVGWFPRRPLGGMERQVPRQHPKILAKRSKGNQVSGDTACGKFRSVFAGRPQAFPLDQLYHEPRRFYVE